jgi:hypothetical protein
LRSFPYLLFLLFIMIFRQISASARTILK